MRSEIAKHLDHDPHFEWRGQTVTRLENLSDIVFALALGMLLLTDTPPSTYTELISFLINIVPVAAGFAILFGIWNAHFTFFRRYGLADGKIVFLNSMILLLVLFVAYPLRFIFDSLFGYVIFLFTEDATRLMLSEMNYQNSARGVAIFNAGFAMIIFLTSLMYQHALSKADMLGLSQNEIRVSKRTMGRYRGETAIASLVVVLAIFTPLGPFSGALLGLSWPNAVYWENRFKLVET
ncbi:MAG: TMEM175 family protein [Pseudomonadota bacterium]